MWIGRLIPVELFFPRVARAMSSRNFICWTLSKVAKHSV
jgi:hypothetical protein